MSSVLARLHREDAAEYTRSSINVSLKSDNLQSFSNSDQVISMQFSELHWVIWTRVAIRPYWRTKLDLMVSHPSHTSYKYFVLYLIRWEGKTPSFETKRRIQTDIQPHNACFACSDNIDASSEPIHSHVHARIIIARLGPIWAQISSSDDAGAKGNKRK